MKCQEITDENMLRVEIRSNDVTPCVLMNADGSDQTRLTNNPVCDYQPSWAPDGTKIVFISREDIYVMNANDGSDRINLATILLLIDPLTKVLQNPKKILHPPVLTVPDDKVVEATNAKEVLR